MAKRPPSRLAEAMLETAKDMHELGIMDDATYEKIRLRHLGEKAARALERKPGRKPTPGSGGDL